MPEKMIKGYKGFNKGLICRDKQYAENTVFNEDRATLYESGMHFCENPLNVLGYYPYYNSGIKSFSEYAEVEAPENVIESNGEKSVTKQLKIGSKISFDELIKAGVEFNLSKAKSDKKKSAVTNMYCGARATGDKSGASVIGDFSGVSVVGNYSGASAVGNYSGASATGNSNGASVVGRYSGASATGDFSGVSAVGWHSGASTTGDYSGASAVGWHSGASTTGVRSGAMVVGDDSQAMCKNNSVAVAIGKESIAKGDIDCYIVLTECRWNSEIDRYKIIDCKCFKVDGETIKADTFYKLINGKPVEV